MYVLHFLFELVLFSYMCFSLLSHRSWLVLCACMYIWSRKSTRSTEPAHYASHQQGASTSTFILQIYYTLHTVMQQRATGEQNNRVVNLFCKLQMCIFFFFWSCHILFVFFCVVLGAHKCSITSPAPANRGPPLPFLSEGRRGLLPLVSTCYEGWKCHRGVTQGVLHIVTDSVRFHFLPSLLLYPSVLSCIHLQSMYLAREYKCSTFLTETVVKDKFISSQAKSLTKQDLNKCFTEQRPRFDVPKALVNYNSRQK